MSNGFNKRLKILNFKERLLLGKTLLKIFINVSMFKIHKIKYFEDGGIGDPDNNETITGGFVQSMNWKPAVSAIGIAGANIGQNLSSANTVNSSSEQSANVRYNVAKGLMSSGNPYAMAAGAGIAALQASGGFGDNSMTSGDALAESMGLGKSFDNKTKIMSWALPGAGWFANKTHSYKASDELQKMASAYAGTASSALTAEKNAGAKVLGRRNRKKVNNFIDEVNRQDTAIQNIYQNSRDTQNAASSMASILASRTQNELLGYNSVLARAAKLGGILKTRQQSRELSKTFWESKVLKTGGLLTQEAEIRRLTKEFWSNPARFEVNPQKFQDGGTMNVIPEGNLHARKHHMEDDEHITKKGIPVVDSEGRQQAEIEVNELILTYEVTKTVEAWWKEWCETEDPKRKEELAILCGKYLTDQIINNTDDRTGLIRKTKI